jgi:predicted acetyltransferase
LVRPFLSKPDRWEAGDFFIARRFKGRGIGKACAFHVFDTHPGQWIIRVLNGNRGALAFWAKVVEDYTQGIFVQTNERFEDPHSGSWYMKFYRFHSKEANKMIGRNTNSHASLSVKREEK